VPGRRDRRQARVRIAEGEDRVRPLVDEDPLAPFDDRADLRADRLRGDAEVQIRLRPLELLEEHVRQPAVVVLAGVHEHVLDVGVRDEAEEEAEPNELGPRPDHRHELHRLPP
jgi:hypothetical protein